MRPATLFPPRDRPKVIVVEDEPLIGAMLADEFADRGFEVRLCSSGEEALQALPRMRNVDALLTDIDLGSGIDGWDVARRVRARCPDLPVIYASGRWAAPDPARAVPQSAMLPKPYRLDVAADLLEHLIRRRRERLARATGDFDARYSARPA